MRAAPATYRHRRPTGWMLKAACKGAPPDRFFPDPPDTTSTTTIREFCAPCPVTTACLAFALGDAADDQHGIWGGTLPASRKALLSEATRLA